MYVHTNSYAIIAYCKIICHSFPSCLPNGHDDDKGIDCGFLYNYIANGKCHKTILIHFYGQKMKGFSIGYWHKKMKSKFIHP